MMRDFWLNAAVLSLQSGILLSVGAREFFTRSGRNLFGLLMPMTILLLVQGQAWWVFAQFWSQPTDRLDIVNNAFGIGSATLANIYLLLATVAYATVYVGLRSTDAVYVPRPLHETASPEPGVLAYLAVAGCAMMFGTLLVSKVGGLELAVTMPGQIHEGQTFLLLAVSIAKCPLLYKIAFRQNLKLVDIALFALALLFLVFNSRFLAAFAILQFVLVMNYCRKEVTRSSLLVLVVPAVAIFIGFGVYREFAHSAGTVGVFEAFQEYVNRGSDFGLLDWFYRFNVEAFSGVAGIVEYERQSNSFQHDFGASEIATLLNLLPSAVRADPSLPFAELFDSLRAMYPYTGSVVPSGLERAFAHFGLAGMVAYGSFLGFLTWYFHRATQAGASKRLFALILSVQLLNGVRGSFLGAVLFFGLADMVLFGLFAMLARGLRVRDSVQPPGGIAHAGN